MSHIITESEVEQVTLDILSELKYKVIYGPDIAPDGPHPERQSYSDIILIDRLNPLSGQSTDYRRVVRGEQA